jgi:hypothetical protein
MPLFIFAFLAYFVFGCQIFGIYLFGHLIFVFTTDQQKLKSIKKVLDFSSRIWYNDT